MENTINNQSELVEIFRKTFKKEQDNQMFKELDKISQYYNDMVKSGMIKKRGYSLRGIEDSRLLQACFNVNPNK